MLQSATMPLRSFLVGLRAALLFTVLVAAGCAKPTPASATDGPEASTADATVPRTPDEADSPACAKARAALEEFLAAAPRACAHDTDCAAYSVRVENCAPQVVAAKPGFDGPLEAGLLLRQKALRAACTSPPTPACAMTMVRVACKQGACVARDEP